MTRYMIILAGVALTITCIADKPWQANANEQPGDTQIQRGAYLVDVVARCGDCHTPRNDKGVLDETQHLQGAPLWFTTNYKFKKWEKKVPDITASGIAGKWSEDELVKFFSNGKQVDMPMPVYKMTTEDAKAVTAYLRSLPGKKK
jgi:mono/diheme cytochrome c family protein